MIRTIILDFDGTIGDTRALIVRTMRQTLAALGLPPQPDSHCAATIGLPLRQGFATLMPMDEATAARCEATYREIFARNNAGYRVPLFPHVTETMAALHAAGLTLAIASSRSRQSLTAFLRDMGLEDCVACVVAANDVEHAKPAPDMVLKILHETGGTASEAIVVGDTRYDIAMGRRAGTLTCAVSYGNGQPEELADADYHIDDFGELSNIVGI